MPSVASAIRYRVTGFMVRPPRLTALLYFRLKREEPRAAIKRDDVARDVARARRREKHREIGELVRLAHALHRHFFLRPLFACFGGRPALVDLLTAQFAWLDA